MKKLTNILNNNSSEEIKICARLSGTYGLGMAAGYMIFDDSMPEFLELKTAVLKATQKYLMRINNDISDHEKEIYDKLSQKFK